MEGILCQTKEHAQLVLITKMVFAIIGSFEFQI